MSWYEPQEAAQGGGGEGSCGGCLCFRLRVAHSFVGSGNKPAAEPGSFFGPLRISYSFYIYIFEKGGTFLDPQVYFGIRSTIITSVSVWKTTLRNACCWSKTLTYTEKWRICLTFTLRQSSPGYCNKIRTTLVISDNSLSILLQIRLVRLADAYPVKSYLVGYSLLHTAAIKIGDIRMLKILFDRGADPRVEKCCSFRGPSDRKPDFTMSSDPVHLNKPAAD
jgi:hypothetical protein